MAKSTTIYCKKCGKKTKHWDNTGTEREKSLGKFVCSICKNPYTPKPKETNYNPTKTTSKEYKDYGDKVPKSMFGAWATNLVIAFIEKGVIKTIEQSYSILEKTINYYDALLNSKESKQNISTQEETYSDDVQENLEENNELDVDDFDLSDLDINL